MGVLCLEKWIAAGNQVCAGAVGHRRMGWAQAVEQSPGRASRRMGDEGMDVPGCAHRPLLNAPCG